MEKAPGIELGRIWNRMKPRDKLSISKQIASITSKLSQARFRSYGSLYFRKDLGGFGSVDVDDTFAIGPTTSRSWFDDRRSEIDISRGPWSSAEELMRSFAERELKCLEKFSNPPQHCQQGLYYGPGGYHPTKDAKASVLHDFLKVVPYILPKLDFLNAGIMWHSDLHTDNIFVDEANPSKISSAIDWQAIAIYPMFLTVSHPALLDYEGPKVEPFVKPQLPDNIGQLNPKEKKAAKDLFLAQSLWVYYETQVQKEAPNLIQTFRYQDTLPCQILGLIRSTFNDGEPHVQKLLADLASEDIWKAVVGQDDDGNPRIPCPLRYSQDDLERQRQDYAKWERDIEHKAQIIDEIGAYTGWDGAVSWDEYDMVVERLERAKSKFLDREAKTPEERRLWENVWPFKDEWS